MGAFPYDAPQSRPLMDPLLDGFSSPNCLDDPDREKRIKELELLLMSAESEVQRQSRDPRTLDHYSSWSDGLSDDTLEDQGVETRSWRGSDVSSGAPNLSSGAPPHPPVSPSRFLSETSTVLSSLQNIPEFAETMELIDSMCFALQDPVSWSDVGSFDLSETETPPRHHQNISNSPRKTPTKTLPFTPSRFCNLSGAENLHLENPALTSTPVCSQRCLQNTPLHKETTPKHHKENEGSRTPKFRKTVMIQTPRTPTPFKNALAAQEKMHGPLKMEPQPLAFLEEDIREVLKQETGSDIFNRADTQPDYRIEGPARKVRKSLVLDPWGKDCLNVQLFQINNNQDSDEGLLMGSSLIQDQECGRSLSSLSSLTESSLAPRRCSPRKKKLLSSHKAQKHTSVQVSEWEAVVYGKTEDQLMMTEAARQYLTSTSRTLVL
ncbi:Myb-related protein A [Dissostichus eleginoides]|uniref:Myb-related protein A n=1 Tax=Dissostichus eleginoides TaxID=100907 RepID=A0AAD9F233_DISEL|nr:Myb-related protein A [Dissostichus eleginoides]